MAKGTAPAKTATPTVVKTGPIHGMSWKWLVALIAIPVIWIIYGIFSDGGSATDGSGATPPINKQVVKTGHTAPWFNVTFNANQPKVKTEAEEVKLTLKKNAWSETVRIKVGKTFTETFDGKVIVEVNRRRMYLYDRSEMKCYPLDQSGNMIPVSDRPGSGFKTVKDFGDNVSEVRYMSGDSEDNKLLTVTITDS